ncbi:MAG: hypothetical protein RBR43_07795 [Desulfuromonadaceae bacterium]|jgi:hypothetical protein|nr:hypothetical protein [Desulfuromonadaceae bacterium]
MFKKAKAGSNLARFGSMPAFLSVIIEQHKIYSDFLHKHQSLDSLDNEAIIRLNQKQLDPFYISTIFSAMFLEAYIYDYAARKESASYVNNYLDKLDPPAKWVVITKLYNPTGFDTSKQAFVLLKALFKIRNTLTHNKSKAIEKFEDIQKSTSPVLSPIVCLNTIHAVMSELLTIDPNELYASIIVDDIKAITVAYPA